MQAMQCVESLVVNPHIHVDVEGCTAVHVDIGVHLHSNIMVAFVTRVYLDECMKDCTPEAVLHAGVHEAMWTVDYAVRGRYNRRIV